MIVSKGGNMEIWNDINASADERVDALIKDMTLREKLHQLGSYWMRDEDEAAPAPDPSSGSTKDDHQVAPMENQFAADHLPWEETIDGGLGHITRNWGTDPVTVSEGREKLIGLQKQVIESNRHGIPAIVHEECLTGFTAYQATVYPAAIAWGATWNPELVEEMASRIGEDMRAVGVHQGLSPLLDVVRDYRWGRVEETAGEDPYLVGTIGTGYVKGLQSAGVSATLKHFVGYSASRGGRNHAPVSMGRRELEDYMLPPFEMAVREGDVDSVMNSYSDIDGVPAASSHFLLTEVLRDRWGFDGVVVSDYWTVKFLETMHRVASTRGEAGAAALSAGLDVELPEAVCYYEIEQLVENGDLDESIVDTAVSRVLLHKIQHGLLDPDWDQASDVDGERDLDSKNNRETAASMARESVILLKNDGILPLDPAKKMIVAGPIWGEVRSFMGCYSFANHVLERYPELGTGLEIKGLNDSFKDFADSEPVFVAGTGFMDGTDEEIAEAVEKAKVADVAIVTVGDIAGMFGSGTSGEGCDVADLGLPGRQGELLDAVLNTGTPTIAVLVTGRPYAIGEYANRCAAIVQAFMPGVEGADAIVGVLSGEINPSGKLPIAIPNTRGGQPGTYLVPPLGWESEGISNINPRPKYPFGHGLSYSTFEYSNVQVSASEVPLDGSLTYSVTVTNTSDRDGLEVVQLYAGDPVGEVVRPIKQLIGYRKIELRAGQRARVTFDIHTDRFSFTGADMKRIVEGGDIQLWSGGSSEDLTDEIRITLEKGRREVGEGRVLVTPVTVEVQ